MKKIQLILATFAFTTTIILAIISFIICFLGFIMDMFHNIDLGALTAFDIVFWLSGYILLPIVKECYDE